MIGRQPWQLDYKYRSHAALTNTLTNLGASSRLGETKVIENGHLYTVASHHDQPPAVMAQPWAKKKYGTGRVGDGLGEGGPEAEARRTTPPPKLVTSGVPSRDHYFRSNPQQARPKAGKDLLPRLPRDWEINQVRCD